MSTTVETLRHSGNGRFGAYWWLVYSFVALMAGFSFSCAPAVIIQPHVELPPAYLLKSHAPFADTAKSNLSALPGDVSHGAKLTPRIVGSLALWATTRLGLHPYWPASIGGILFLVCGVVTSYRLTKDRFSSLATGCLFAGLYTLNGCFSVNYSAKPFDGIAVAFISLVLLCIDRPILLAASAFLACWTDERSLLSLVLIAFVVFFAHQIDQKRTIYVAIGIACLAYIFTRLFLSQAMEWTKPDVSMLGGEFVRSLGLVQIPAWICFEGASVLFIAVFIESDSKIFRAEKAILAALIAIALASCLFVLDVSRATMFCFPLIYAPIAMLARAPAESNRLLRLSIGIAACVNLLSVNIEYIAGMVFNPLPSLVMDQWLDFFGRTK